MSKGISQRAFSRLAGVTAAAVRHALADGRLMESDAGLDPDEGTNAFFLEGHQQKAIEAMEEKGRVLPGWAALCVPFPGRDPCPVFFLPPQGETFLSSVDAFDDWRFDSETWLAIDPAGKVHKMTLVMCPQAAPPWLDTAARTGGVKKGHSKGRADRTTGRHARRRA